MRAPRFGRHGTTEKEIELGRSMPPGHLLNKSPFVARFDCRGKREGLSYLGLHEPTDMANTSDIKNGMVLNHNNGLWQIVEFLHVKRLLFDQ